MRAITCLFAFLLSFIAAQAQSTSFTYQGRLDEAGQPANGAYDVRFTLFGVETGGSPISGVVCADDVPVVNGLFTVIVPLTAPTVGDAFLEVQVRPGAAGTCASATGYTTMTPRQSLTPAPKAVYAHAVPAQSPPMPGALRYNAANNRFEGSDGQFWYPLTMGAPLPPANAQTFPVGSHSFVVPAGVTRLGVDMYGGGGAGGNRGPGIAAANCSSTGPFPGAGGGGAAGTYVRAILDVTPGETLTLVVGQGGSPTAGAGQAGQNSTVMRGATVVLRAFGGGGGGQGTTHASINTTGSCSHPPSGAPGASGAPAQLLGSGNILANNVGGMGGIGRGPACAGGFPSSIFCGPGPLGVGGNSSPSVAPLPVISAGQGGNGAEASNTPPAAAGGAGVIRVFWD
ncbi:MAG TPA: hypothetical protein VD997_07140 [Phycisphaerales bacterium]|nr:hypothetical protein [Phycisphaerales bacterium]